MKLIQIIRPLRYITIVLCFMVGNAYKPVAQKIFQFGIEQGLSNNGVSCIYQDHSTLSAKTIIRKWIEAEERAENPLTGHSELLSQMDLITIAQLIKAKKGDTGAFSVLLDRLEGKPKHAVDTNTDNKVAIRVLRSRNPSLKTFASNPPCNYQKQSILFHPNLQRIVFQNDQLVGSCD